jgi:hypothetical protein
MKEPPEDTAAGNTKKRVRKQANNLELLAPNIWLFACFLTCFLVFLVAVSSEGIFQIFMAQFGETSSFHM